MSGHGFIIGCRTGLIIGLDVRGKKCAKCYQANKKNLPVRDHKCSINYKGSSGAMESKVALSLTEQLFNNSNGRLYVKHLVSDDDSTMRSLLTHQNVNDTAILMADCPHLLNTTCMLIYLKLGFTNLKIFLVKIFEYKSMKQFLNKLEIV